MALAISPAMNRVMAFSLAALALAGCAADMRDTDVTGETDDSANYVTLDISKDPTDYRVYCKETFSCDFAMTMELWTNNPELEAYLDQQIGDQDRGMVQLGHIEFLNPPHESLPIEIEAIRLADGIGFNDATHHELHFDNPDAAIWTTIALEPEVPVDSLHFSLYTEVW